MNKHYDISHPCVKQCACFFIKEIESGRYNVVNITDIMITCTPPNGYSMATWIQKGGSVVLSVGNFEYGGQKVSFLVQIPKGGNTHCSKFHQLVESLVVLHEMS